ncbi:uncharacterized protein ACIQIH_006159 isoform 2-T2 [Cyanocitta cristata]
MKEESGTRMAENVLYADLNLPESTRPRILKVPDVPGCTYAEVKVKSQDANDTTNFKSSCDRCCSRRLLAVLAAVLVVAVLALTLCWTLLYGATAGSQEHSTTTIPEEALDGATAGSQQNSTKLPPSHEGAPGKRCCSRTRVAVLVTGIILLLLIFVCQILPCKSRCSRRLLAVLAAVLVVAVLALTLCWTLLYGATAGSQEHSTTTIPEEALDGATAGSQQNSTKLPPSHEGAPGKRCCSRTRVAVLVTGIILLLLIFVCQILPCKSRCCSRRLLAVLAAVLVVAVLALTLCWTLLYGATAGSQEHSTTTIPEEALDGATAGSQEHSTTTIPEEALGCPPKWEKHGRKCYFFSPEKKVKDWKASRDECAALGSELVIIDSREELNYLLSRSRYNYYLLGLRFSQEEKKWKWLNNVEHDPAMFNIRGNDHRYLCTVIGFGEVQTAPCYGSPTTQNMCEKAATVSARLQEES